eukprot:1159545-Pelagomonas_calceolata.AAC.1
MTQEMLCAHTMHEHDARNALCPHDARSFLCPNNASFWRQASYCCQTGQTKAPRNVRAALRAEGPQSRRNKGNRGS